MATGEHADKAIVTDHIQKLASLEQRTQALEIRAVEDRQRFAEIAMRIDNSIDRLNDSLDGFRDIVSSELRKLEIDMLQATTMRITRLEEVVSGVLRAVTENSERIKSNSSKIWQFAIGITMVTGLIVGLAKLLNPG